MIKVAAAEGEAALRDGIACLGFVKIDISAAECHLAFIVGRGEGLAPVVPVAVLFLTICYLVPYRVLVE